MLRLRLGLALSLGGLLMSATSWCGAQPLSFAQALELARQNDPRVQMVRQDLEVRRAQLEGAYGQLLPSVSMSYSRFDGNRTTLGAGTSSQPIGFVSENTSWTVRQPIYRKSLSAGYEKAQALLSAGEFDLQREEMDLSLRTLQAYLEVLTVQQLIQANAAQVDTLTAQLDYVRRALAKGFTRTTDLLEAESRLRAAQADRRGLQDRLALGWTQLARLTRVEQPSLWRISPQRVQGLLLPAASLSEWWGRAQQGSLQLRSLLAQQEAAKFDMSMATSGHLPTVDLLYQDLSSANELPNSPNLQYRTKQIGVQLVVPIYSGGTVNASERSAQAALTKIQWQISLLGDQLQVDVQSSYNDLLDAQRRMEQLAFDLKAKKENVIAIEMAYKAGLDTQLSLLQARERLQQTHYGHLEQAGKYLQAWLKLHSICGLIDEKFISDFSQWFDRE